jgi:excisionase family DNA binding protein
MQELITYEDVSRISRFKIGTLRKWVQTGKIPFTKINGAIRFYPAEIAKWMAEKARDFKPCEKKGNA